MGLITKALIETAYLSRSLPCNAFAALDCLPYTVQDISGAIWQARQSCLQV